MAMRARGAAHFASTLEGLFGGYCRSSFRFRRYLYSNFLRRYDFSSATLYKWLVPSFAADDKGALQQCFFFFKAGVKAY